MIVVRRWLMVCGLGMTGLFFAVLTAWSAPGDVDTDAGAIPVFPLLRPDDSFYEIENGRITLWNSRASGGPLDQFSFQTPFLSGNSFSWSVYDPALLLSNGDLLIPAAGSRAGPPPGPQVSHLIRLQPNGQRVSSFGVDGVVSLEDMDTARFVAPRRVVAGLHELNDGRIIVLEADSSCALTVLGYGPKLDWDDSSDFHCAQPTRTLLRLLSDGRTDTTFGSAGRASVSGGAFGDQTGAFSLFLVRPDGAILLGGPAQKVQLIHPSGEAFGVTELDFRVAGGALLADGSFVAFGEDPQFPLRLRVAHLGTDLESDPGYGGSAGFAIDFADVLDTLPEDASLSVGDSVLDESGNSLYVHVGVWSSSRGCAGIARITLLPQAALDPSFGSGGFACFLNERSFSWDSSLQRQSDGGLLLSTYDYEKFRTLTLRFHTDGTGGAGVISPSTTTLGISEGAGEAVLRVSRTGGTRGALALQWRTEANRASAGLDYVESGGTLSWPEGDDTSREIRIPILEDSGYESTSWENFDVRFTLAPGSASALMLRDSVRVLIQENDPPPPPSTSPPSLPPAAVSPPPASADAGAGGGAGASDPASLLWLLGLWAARRARRSALAAPRPPGWSVELSPLPTFIRLKARPTRINRRERKPNRETGDSLRHIRGRPPVP